MDTGEMLRRGMRIGFGALHMSKEKARKLAKQLEKEGAVGASETEKVARQLFAEGKLQGEKMQKFVQQEVAFVLQKVGVATRKDLEKLRKEVKRKKR